MAYTKHTWTQRLGVKLNRFKDILTGSYLELVNEPTSVSQAGTPLRADWLNEMEQGIADAHTIGEAAQAAADEKNLYTTWVDGDVLEFAMGIPTGAVAYFTTSGVSTGLPGFETAYYRYSTGFVLSRATDRTVAAYNRINGDIAMNTYQDGAWSGWRKPSASDSDKLDGKDSTAFATAAHDHAGYMAYIAKGYPSTYDLNILRTPGQYLNAGSPAFTNRPVGCTGIYCHLIVIGRTSTHISQILIDAAGKIYTRQYTNSAWTPWAALTGASYGTDAPPSTGLPSSIYIQY